MWLLCRLFCVRLRCSLLFIAVHSRRRRERQREMQRSWHAEIERDREGREKRGEINTETQTDTLEQRDTGRHTQRDTDIRIRDREREGDDEREREREREREKERWFNFNSRSPASLSRDACCFGLVLVVVSIKARQPAVLVTTRRGSPEPSLHLLREVRRHEVTCLQVDVWGRFPRLCLAAHLHLPEEQVLAANRQNVLHKDQPMGIQEVLRFHISCDDPGASLVRVMPIG